MPLRRPKADTGALVSAALTGLKAIFRPGFNYTKARVMLMDLQADTVSQDELDLEGDDIPDNARLMLMLYGPNKGFGKGSVLMASAGLAGDQRAWVMKQ